MKGRRTPGEDGTSIDLTDAGEIAAVKLENLFNKCLANGRTPKPLKNKTIILIH